MDHPLDHRDRGDDRKRGDNPEQQHGGTTRTGAEHQRRQSEQQNPLGPGGDAHLAFDAEAFGPGRFARTAYRVREGVPPIADLSLTARLDDRVVGGVRFTAVRIGNEDKALLLGPLVIDPAHKGNGFGVALAPNAIATLRELGVAETVISRGFQPTRGEFRRMDGTVVKRAEMPPGFLGGPMLIALRQALHGALLEAFTPGAMMLGKRATRFIDHDDHVTLRFADGSSAEGDVLIVEPDLWGWVEVPPFTGELKYAKSLLPDGLYTISTDPRIVCGTADLTYVAHLGGFAAGLVLGMGLDREGRPAAAGALRAAVRGRPRPRSAP